MLRSADTLACLKQQLRSLQAVGVLMLMRPLLMRSPLCGCAQYLDLGRTYVHWKQGHPRAGADAPDQDAASDASSDEEVEAASQSGPCTSFLFGQPLFS